MIDFEGFQDFCNHLQIQTKEEGLVSLGQRMTGPQKMAMREIRKGIEEDVHEFYFLKARQLGVSTILLAWDLYFTQRYSGVAGSIITHDEPARNQFRAQLEMNYETLPPEYQQDIVQHNRDQIVFRNRSMLQYKVAGLQKTSSKSLGRSSAVSFAHCTEVAFWGDEEQIDSLKASMAETNPLRFFAWESTANGFNHFQRLWEEAKGATTIRGIFIGWWAHEKYRAPRGSRVWRQYWGLKGKPTAQERDWIKRVRKDYGVDLDDEQLAWYRWVLAEKVTDELRLAAEYPTLPEEAFVATGSKYFTGSSLSDAYRRVLGTAGKNHESYKLHFGAEFTDTYLTEVNDKQATLRIWAEPVQKAWYVLGADPAYGSSDNADRFACIVYRAWANRLEQVAEFCTADLSPYTFAWVIVYLAGFYAPCLYNIELNGTGTAVLQEIDNLKRLAGKSPIAGQAAAMRNVIKKMTDFLYAREDSMTGRPQGKHTLTTARVKETYMGLMKDSFEREQLVIHSRHLLDEMKSIIRDGGQIVAEGSSKDDRVIAAALGVKAWNDQLRNALMARNVIWTDPGEKPVEEKPPQTLLGGSVQRYLQSVGAIPRPQNRNTGVHAYNLK